MPTKKTPTEKPLSVRDQLAAMFLQALLGKLGDRILDAHDGEVYQKLVDEAYHCADVFLAKRGA